MESGSESRRLVFLIFFMGSGRNLGIAQFIRINRVPVVLFDEFYAEKMTAQRNKHIRYTSFGFVLFFQYFS